MRVKRIRMPPTDVTPSEEPTLVESARGLTRSTLTSASAGTLGTPCAAQGCSAHGTTAIRSTASHAAHHHGGGDA